MRMLVLNFTCCNKHGCWETVHDIHMVYNSRLEMQVSTGSQGNAVREERGVFKAKAFPGKYEASLEFPAGKVGGRKNSL